MLLMVNICKHLFLRQTEKAQVSKAEEREGKRIPRGAERAEREREREREKQGSCSPEVGLELT